MSLQIINQCIQAQCLINSNNFILKNNLNIMFFYFNIKGSKIRMLINHIKYILESMHDSCDDIKRQLKTKQSIDKRQNSFYYRQQQRMIRSYKLFLILLTIAIVSQQQQNGTEDGLPCDISCQTCWFGQDPQYCLTCSTGQNRNPIIVDGQNQTCSCLPGYYDNGQAVCPPCNYVCATCSSNDSNCDSCNQNREAAPACTCIQQYYDDGSTSNCLPCNYTCKSCNSADQCSSCDPTFDRSLTQLSPFCLCNDRYYDSGVEICSPCDPTCFRCNGPDNSDCTACNLAAHRILQLNSCFCSAGFFLTSLIIEDCAACLYSCQTCSSVSTCDTCDGSQNRVLINASCLCGPQYFENINMLCELCDSSCATCSNLTSCTTCISSQLTTISGSGLCFCTSTQYWNNSDCEACNYNCLTCVASASTCTSCPTNSNRIYANGTCNCGVGYYDSGSVVCLSCINTCFTCEYNINCSSCDLSMNRKLQTGQCLCLIGYYNSDSSVVCLPCSYKCLNCNGPESCSSCNTTLSRSLNNVTEFCQCNAFYFEYKQICYPCALNCLSCSNNATCTSCNSSLFRILNNSTNLCDCESGLYVNSSNLCASCNSNCATCNSSSTCLSCKPNLSRSLNSSSLTCDCSLGYVLNLTSNLCTVCQYSCLYCVTNYTNHCSSCNSSAYRTLNATSSQCQCNTGYYDDGINALCQKCSYFCKACVVSANQCTSCPSSSNRIYNSSTNSCLCAQHYYDNIINYVQNANCLACPYSCSSCIWASTCVSCNSTLFRIMNSTGGCICLASYYDDGSHQKCLACSYKCQTCTNSTSCLTCNISSHRDIPNSSCPCINNYYDAGNQTSLCLSCHYTCATCSSPNACLSCQSAYQRVYNSTTQLCSCNQRYFDIGTQNCSACTYSCLSCSNTAIQCSTCNTSAMRTFSSVIKSCVCNAGYFDIAIQQCYACSYSCATCSNNQTCLTCNLTIYRTMNNKTGLCICSIGYYDNNITQACPACQLTCLTCMNSTNCLTCDINRNRVLNVSADYANTTNPFCPCLYKYYSLGLNSSCSPCYFSCSYCNGPNINNCLFCDSIFQRKMATGSPKCICKSGYYDTNITQLCLACNIACLTCFNSLNTTCFTCNSTNYIIVGTTICYNICPAHYYSDNTSMVCSLCATNCLYCINSHVCTSCNATAFLFNSSCLLACPLRYYGDTTNNSCVLCKVGCANCSLSTNCFKCMNTSYYVDFATTQCLQCSIQCVTCFGPFPNQCLNCVYPLYLNSQYTCVNLTCPYGKYVDTFKGCVNCSELFNFSLTCNISQAFLCSGTYQLENGVCLPCNEVTGYAIDSYGDCTEICGDGILIYYQCDDGNNLNGDGCSANCVIQSGWTCLNNSGFSVCDLTNGVSMEVQKWMKYQGTNKLRLIISISLPLRLTSNNFALTILDMNAADYLCTLIPQDQSNLAQLTVDISYFQSIESKSINLTYQKIQKIRFRRLLLNDTGLSNVLKINSFPPANFISSDTINTYNIISQIINSLSVVFLILNLIIVPKLYALHSITMVWITPFLFFTYSYSTSYTTEWISKIMAQTQPQSFYQGFSFGSCCSIDNFKNMSSQLTYNIGYILVILLLSWLIFGIIKLFSFNCFSQRSFEWFTMFKYYLFTIHLIVLPQLCYSSLYSLSNFRLSNNIDAINTTLSLLIFFSVLFLLTSLFYLTKISKFIGSYKQMSSKATRHSGDKQLQNTEESHQSKIIDISKQQSNLDDNSNFNISRTFISRKNQTNDFIKTEDQIDKISHNQQLEEEEMFFMFDYGTLYNSHPQSKYFLPLLMIRIVICLIIMVSLSNYAFEMMVINTFINLLFVCFLVKVRPFQSTFTNIRLILIELLLLITNGIYAVYQYFANLHIYVSTLQMCILVGIICILTFSIIFSLIEHYKAWMHKIWRCCEDCCLSWRLKGPSTKIYDRQDQSSNIIKVQSVVQSDMGQVDAFFARVLQKNALNRQYQKQRMLHHRRHRFQKSFT